MLIPNVNMKTFQYYNLKKQDTTNAKLYKPKCEK